VYIKGR